MARQTQLQRIMREQGLLCANCGEFAKERLCDECQIESDETAELVELPTGAVANEIKAKALGVLMAAKRADIIMLGREQAFDWLRQQALERGIASELQENFVYGVATLYLQSLG